MNIVHLRDKSAAPAIPGLLILQCSNFLSCLVCWGSHYEYALRDYLGNTRVVFTDNGAAGIQDQTEIMFETHSGIFSYANYSPFWVYLAYARWQA